VITVVEDVRSYQVEADDYEEAERAVREDFDMLNYELIEATIMNTSDGN
jgi:hypothetical protein